MDKFVPYKYVCVVANAGEYNKAIVEILDVVRSREGLPVTFESKHATILTLSKSSLAELSPVTHNYSSTDISPTNRLTSAVDVVFAWYVPLRFKIVNGTNKHEVFKSLLSLSNDWAYQAAGNTDGVVPVVEHFNESGQVTISFICKANVCEACRGSGKGDSLFGLCTECNGVGVPSGKATNCITLLEEEFYDRIESRMVHYLRRTYVH